MTVETDSCWTNRQFLLNTLVRNHHQFRKTTAAYYLCLNQIPDDLRQHVDLLHLFVSESLLCLLLLLHHLAVSGKYNIKTV